MALMAELGAADGQVLMTTPYRTVDLAEAEPVETGCACLYLLVPAKGWKRMEKRRTM